MFEAADFGFGEYTEIILACPPQARAVELVLSEAERRALSF